MFSKAQFLGLLLLMFCQKIYSQNITITNGDGSQLKTRYCWENTNYTISAQPAGGSFTGCGMQLQNGQWQFNPIVATQGVTTFPYQCTITYTVNGNSTVANIIVWKPVVVDPPLIDTGTCSGHFKLNATMLYAGAYDYQWLPATGLDRADTNVTNGFLNQSTTYVIIATDQSSNCTGTDTIIITKYPVPQVSLTNDTTVLAREQLLLTAQGAETYTWEPATWLSADNIHNPISTPQAPIRYTVTGKNQFGCSDTASVFINIHEEMFIPNAFSPNGDGKNDVFKIINFGYQEIAMFHVYSRWGELVFSTKDGSRGWDGTYRNKPADVGIYCYLIKIVTEPGITKDFKGQLMLLR